MPDLTMLKKPEEKKEENMTIEQKYKRGLGNFIKIIKEAQQRKHEKRGVKEIESPFTKLQKTLAKKLLTALDTHMEDKFAK